MIGCSAEETQYGVITGSVPGTPLEPGTRVEVAPFDSRAGTFTVTVAESGNRYQVLPSLVNVFETATAADQFVEEAGDALGMTASSLVHALRVRSEPRRDSDVVYRLRAGEDVQLVRSTDSTSTINGRTGVWYELIAGGQHRGYAFGPLLAGTPSEASRRAARGNEAGAPLTILTEAIGGEVWISTATNERFAAGGLDLTAMRLTDDAVVIRINDEERRLALDSVEIEGDAAVFEDGQVRMTFSSEDEVRATVDGDDGPRFIVFRPRDEVSWVQLWSEYQRRRDVAALLTEHAGVYRSATYGTVRVYADGRIQWTDKEALVPRVFRAEEIQEFGVRYLPRISSALQRAYDGAIMLEVSVNGSNPVFLVDLLPDALRMVWVPGFNVEEPTVVSAPVTPLIMYFSAVEEAPADREAG
ncbi:MAG: SH3 domain-containing protein [Alkalispirochaeta sp.]